MNLSETKPNSDIELTLDDEVEQYFAFLLKMKERCLRLLKEKQDLITFLRSSIPRKPLPTFARYLDIYNWCTIYHGIDPTILTRNISNLKPYL